MVVSCWWGIYGGIGIDDEIGDIVGAGRGFYVHIVAVAGVGEDISDGVDVVVVDDDDGC
jgi:hypothetical protein